MTNHRKQSKNKFRCTSNQLKMEEFLTTYMLENSDRMFEDIKLITDPNVSETEKIQRWLAVEIVHNLSSYDKANCSEFMVHVYDDVEREAMQRRLKNALN